MYALTPRCWMGNFLKVLAFPPRVSLRPEERRRGSERPPRSPPGRKKLLFSLALSSFCYICYLLVFVVSLSRPPLPSHEAAVCWSALCIAVGPRYRLSGTSSAVFASLAMSGVRTFIIGLFKHLLGSSGIYKVHIKLPALMKLMDMVLAKSTVTAGTSCSCLGST